MAYTEIEILRSNAVLNPRAHVDVTNWTDAERFATGDVPVDLPAGTDAAFYVAPMSGGRICVSNKWALPDGVESGDWLYVQFEAYVYGVVAGDCALWGDIEFYDAFEQTQGWVSFCRDAEVPTVGFLRYGAMVQIPGSDATQFLIYTKCDDIKENGASTAHLFFTNVSVEKCWARNIDLPDYADGDSEGWEWSGVEHLSESHQTESDTVQVMDIVEETLTLTGDNTYVFPALADDWVLEVHFGPRICQVFPFVEEGMGTIDPEVMEVVQSGDPITITWGPAVGWDFDRCTLDDVEVSPTSTGVYTIASVIDHHWFRVYFVPETRTLAYTAGSNGSIEGDPAQTVDYGGMGTAVKAVADEGYHFTTWSDSITSARRLDSQVESNLSVTASFAAGAVDTFDLTYTADANGTIVGDATQEDVPEGTSGTEVVATPNEGYHFVAWSDDYTDSAERTDLFVHENVTAEASFAEDVMWILTYAADTGGTLTGSTPQEVLDGESGTLVIAVPDPGYRFTAWSDDRLVASRRELYVEEDLSVTAYFEEEPIYDLTYSAGTGGSISGVASQQVARGGRGTMVTAVPSAGYHFTSWSDAKSTASRIDVGVSADVTVTASFALNNVTLRYRGIGGGTITGSNPQTVAYGGNGTEVEAVPDADYHFDVWSDEVATAKRTDLAVTANLRVYAKFELDSFTLAYFAGSGGTLRGDASQSVKHGRMGMPVTAIPNTGYAFEKWSDDVMTARRRDLDVQGNVSVTASFTVVP